MSALLGRLKSVQCRKKRSQWLINEPFSELFWTFLIQNKLFKSFSCEFFYLNCLKSCGKIWLAHRIFFPVSWKNFPKNHWEFIKTESENSKKICPTHRKNFFSCELDKFFPWVGQTFLEFLLSVFTDHVNNYFNFHVRLAFFWPSLNIAMILLNS